jgi:long-chain acyl-CoA synthetase
MIGMRKVVYPIWVKLILGFLRGWLVIYDLLAYLPFKFFASPKQKLQRSNRLKAKPLVQNDPSTPYRNVECPNGELITCEFPGYDTLDKLFERSFNLYSDKKCLGTRRILSVDQEKQPNGRIFEKYDMGDYEWLSYDRGQRRSHKRILQSTYRSGQWRS